jgi:hypothetical protein
MSDQLFEVAFSGQISDGANADEVRARVAKLFNADEAKLAQLFSGKRIVIKKNIDRAGAECEIAALGGAVEAAPKPAAEAALAAAPQPAASAAAATSQEYESSYEGEVEPPPKTDPLGITGDQIEDLAASIAPVGSELQDDYQAPEEPDIDITGFDIMPVGSELSTAKKEPDPPPPDTSGITLAD